MEEKNMGFDEKSGSTGNTFHVSDSRCADNKKESCRISNSFLNDINLLCANKDSKI